MLVQTERTKIKTFPGWLLPSLLLLWLAVVVATAANHVPWRDEVRALSLAAKATSLHAIFEGVQGEGHPVLWFVLLNLAYHVYSNPIVLKLVSVAIAFAAIVIFLFRAPFPVWFRCLFMFCGLPFFEYSVVARDYGISMLLLFAFAWAYTGTRRNPVLLGLILFLLANTNVHSTGFVVLLLAISVSDGVHDWRSAKARPSRLAGIAGIGLALSGILLCVYTVAPFRREDTIVTRASSERHGFELLYDSVWSAGSEFQAVTGADAIVARVPGGTSPKGRLVAHLPPAFAYLILLLAIAGLAGRPLLASAALASMWGLSLFFMAVYVGGYRHQGLWLIFVLTLYWLAEARSDPPRWPRATVPLRRLSLNIVLPLVFFYHCVHGAHAIINDWRHPYSSSRQLGALLTSRDDLRQAVVISEPEFMLDSLPYYLHNRLYLLRVSRYGNAASWSRHQNLNLSLGEILSTARRLRSETGSPIVILMRPSLDRSQGDLHYVYGYRFTWNEAELARLRRETTHLASLHGAATDENYDVYTVK